MSFYTEPTGYQKTIVSDLQGAWGNLREAVTENPGFKDWDRLLFHIDEAMSWESVRDLEGFNGTNDKREEMMLNQMGRWERTSRPLRTGLFRQPATFTLPAP